MLNPPKDWKVNSAPNNAPKQARALLPVMEELNPGIDGSLLCDSPEGMRTTIGGGSGGPTILLRLGENLNSIKVPTLDHT